MTYLAIFKESFKQNVASNFLHWLNTSSEY